MLIGFADRKRNFSLIGCRIHQIFTDSDHRAEAKFPDHRKDSQILNIIDQRNPLDFIVNKTGFFMKKPGDDVIFFQTVKMFLNPSFIHRFCGSDRHPLSVHLNGLFKVNRINPVNRFTQGALRAQEPHFFCLIKKLIPKIRMGNADHGHGPFL